MNDYFFRDSLSHLTSKILISCNKDPHSGRGGLYVVDFNLKNIRKVLAADCRGIAEFNDGFFVATNSHGILKLDKDCNLINSYEMPSDLDLHGMRYDESTSLLYIVETKRNAIGIYETTPFNRVDEIKISPSDDDQNHLNDIWLEGNRLYVSMFSLKGGFKQREGEQDGVIAEIDLTKKTIVNVLYERLQYPHTVFKINDDFYYCDSLKLNLKKGDCILAQFNGFTRGCAFDGRYFYIGQSEMRHLSKILETQSNVSIDCGIHIFDSSVRTNQFIPFPEKQIYEIVILEKKVEDQVSSIDFSEAVTTKYLVLDSWHDLEGRHRWMSSRKSYIYLNKKEPVQSVKVDAFSAFPGPYNVIFYINGLKVGSHTFTNGEGDILEFPIQQISGKIEVAIEVEQLWSPSEYLDSDDTRSLGLAVRKVSLI
ncbi:DUF4915 domain-containing protein [Paenibacillus cremeus]|uniref:DUF4915 domain-containing protein n=1 Tax=Paenibacillus cremeus TaxID=2163881 RepID=UPI0016495289|nr:DUF4915 domain-containing protein [Paenibacillus cremeus]